MREFEMYEIFKEKCHVCGCRNKVHAELIDKSDKLIGYSLKCCGCGNYKEFMLDYHDNGKNITHDFRIANQKCLQPSHCPRKDCPLFGTCGRDDPSKYEKRKEDSCNCDNTVSIEIFHEPRFL